MNNRLSVACLLGTALLFVSCGKPQSAGPAGASGPGKKRLYWVQPLKGHPVHQLTQIGFRAGCAKTGYDCALIGTETWDIGGTIALAEEALAREDVAGMAIWAGSPAYNTFIERAGKAGIPVVLPHFPAPTERIPGATGVIGCDQREYARAAAVEIGRVLNGQGTVAVTQGSFNTIENLVSSTFMQAMKERYPKVMVLDPVEEGFDPPGAISKAVALLQGHPDVKAVLSTTGGGPMTWANAQKEAGRKVVIVGMDYTRANLDLVRSGEVYALVAQPLWEEAEGSADLLARSLHGEKVDWWTKLPAPLVTKDKLEPYYALLDKVEAAIKNPP